MAASAALVVGSFGTIAFTQAGLISAGPNSGRALRPPTVTATVITTGSPEPTVTSVSPSIKLPPPGTVAVILSIGTNGKIGPAEYRTGANPTAFAVVYDENGRSVMVGCYPTWVLRRGSSVVETARSESCTRAFSVSPDALQIAGNYRLSVSVTTDAGFKGDATADFRVTSVQPNP
ncbi:hypothetical protein [Kribbella sp. NPDC051620]|uniref:hypothetical protein n=1 Tax=Kribbella sp. NPDC051620 TaxID=3364120 RepID=UPI0037BBDC7A